MFGVVKEVAYLGSYTKYLIESNGFNFYAFMQNEEVAENLKLNGMTKSFVHGAKTLFFCLMTNFLKKQNFWFVFTPYFWLVLFFFIPLALIFKISISVSEWGMPPYRDMFTFTENGLSINSTLSNYLFIFSDSFYLRSYLNSLTLAFTSTLICLFIGYPIAFYVAKSKENIRNLLLILLIIPFWTSFLLRVYAWKVILQGSGIINTILIKFGFIDQPISMLHNHYAVILGVVYTYLPFMILPLYGYLVKFDLNLIDASSDLGAKPFKTFFKVIIPLSLPGIVAGSMLFLYLW